MGAFGAASFNLERVMYIILILFISYPFGAYSGLHERMLLEDLLAYYNKLERPVANESEAVVLTFGLTLQQIIDVVILADKIIYFIFHIYDTKGDLEFPLLAVLKLNYFFLSNNLNFFQDEKNQILTTNVWLNLVSGKFSTKYDNFWRLFFPIRSGMT